MAVFCWLRIRFWVPRDCTQCRWPQWIINAKLVEEFEYDIFGDRWSTPVTPVEPPDAVFWKIGNFTGCEYWAQKCSTGRQNDFLTLDSWKASYLGHLIHLGHQCSRSRKMPFWSLNFPISQPFSSMSLENVEKMFEFWLAFTAVAVTLMGMTSVAKFYKIGQRMWIRRF